MKRKVTINRALEAYRRKGYSDDWINQRLKAIEKYCIMILGDYIENN